MTADELALLVTSKGVSPLAAAGCAAYPAAYRDPAPRPRGWRSETGGDRELLFDFASLTKPMTAVAIARAGLDPRESLGTLLPEVRGTASAHAPLELLLAH